MKFAVVAGGLACITADMADDRKSEVGRTPGGGRFAVLILLTGAAAIAFAPIFVRLSELGPAATAFYRLSLSLPVLWLWMAATEGRIRPVRGRAGAGDYGLLCLAGLFFAADLAVWHWSIALTSVANATLLANLAPVFVAFGGFAFFGERFSRLFLFGLAAAVGGAIILMSASAGLGGRVVLGDALGVTAAVFYAAYIIAVGRLRARFSTAEIMAWSGAVTTVALLPVALISGESLIAETAAGWAILGALALLSHAGGQSLIAYSLAHLPAAFTSVGLLAQPVIAAVLAWIILGEALGPVQAAGAVVVLFGIFLARQGSR